MKLCTCLIPGRTCTIAACWEAAGVGLSPAHIICLGTSEGMAAAASSSSAAARPPSPPLAAEGLLAPSADRLADRPVLSAPSTRRRKACEAASSGDIPRAHPRVIANGSRGVAARAAPRPNGSVKRWAGKHGEVGARSWGSRNDRLRMTAPPPPPPFFPRPYNAAYSTPAPAASSMTTRWCGGSCKARATAAMYAAVTVSVAAGSGMGSPRAALRPCPGRSNATAYKPRAASVSSSTRKAKDVPVEP
mmetsp:Transcript_19833/g.32206  ORF Transcript_19833/g.32206 Transcript_19833/m.32206 type:complete len:247 (-) Transcript_19833:51-791(-)